MNIITKFTVATEQGIDTLLSLTHALAREQYAALLDPADLDHYISRRFNIKTLTAEINSLANQWLVVYADNNAAGYARITGKGARPGILEGKRAIRIADFGILRQYTDPAVAAALFDKCLSVCQPYDHTWLQEYTGSPLNSLLERHGFVRQPDTVVPDELPLASVCWIR
ncbi:N-acetyltransferase [Taibaiella chishuiensis]|uniref:N-acetyltransferase domain-containing protein n=1 Tax=Taibaiella chishuiensis TaxID=1434707 RepID=A0A2P8D8H8_9BACT|nr:N-acetyltransferase [Taibaiella chishuiensis]PSK93513.1 hypothetical protein B0I18_102483 [Taibaiella chishuiensis]